MADDRRQTTKEPKGFFNQLKKAIRPGSPQTRSNSPSNIVAQPVETTAPPPAPPAPTVKIDREEAAKLRAKYTHFRILVIGRANAGKTTLLKRVCNTTEEPSIYDEGQNLLEPTAERGIHDVRRSFTFKSNPRFIFHDSRGFEAGGEEEFKAVMTFIEDSTKSKEVGDQIHVIWYCFEPDVSRPLLPLEVKFFNENRVWNVPVVAIFMKFDVLITKVQGSKADNKKDIKNALDILEKKFMQPLSSYKFYPQAYVQFEAINKDNGDHQKQVKKLIKQTAASIDNLALKMLFVTVQQNNLEVSIEYAVNEYIFSVDKMHNLIVNTSSWFGHCYRMEYVRILCDKN
ncbi:hypothetical protein GALMADRAFT_150392 [Galerina marginata CBS 339.88]|uniref:G domain-containing protein n=1 Tax=Galerina marginata (strain CBS 339.88) TaxID=685588 RepID=A0A067TSD0_GALM3|nr:hypothetical protein GALMADRAFT_150392 [Galerina marginata CBS 339.88]